MSMQPFGPIRAYYADLTSGQVYPESMRIESLPFRARVDATGQIQDQTQAQQVNSQFNLVIRDVIAWMQPEPVGLAGSLARFNIMDQGRGFTVFKVNQFIASYFGASQGSHSWDGCFVTVPGSQLEVSWTIDTINWPNQVGVNKHMGVDVVGDYVNCGQPLAPTEG